MGSDSDSEPDHTNEEKSSETSQCIGDDCDIHPQPNNANDQAEDDVIFVRERKRGSTVWDHFTLSNDRATAQCMYCEHIAKYHKSGTTSNLWEHFRRCQRFKGANRKEMPLPISRTLPSLWTSRAQQQLNEMRAFVKNGLAHQLIDEPTFMAAFPTHLNRHKLHDLVFSEARKMVGWLVKHLEGRFVGIVLDGWSNPKGEKCFNFLLADGDGPAHFWTSVNTGFDTLSSQYIADLITSIIRDLEKEKIIAVAGIGDNEAIVKGGGKICEERFPHFVWLPCACHTIELLADDIWGLEPVASSIVKVKDAIGALSAKENHRRFIQLQKVANPAKHPIELTKIVKHRWGSEYDATVKLYSLRAAANQILDDEHKAHISDADWGVVKCVMSLMKPMRLAVASFENKNSTNADVWTRLQGLKAHIEGFTDHPVLGSCVDTALEKFKNRKSEWFNADFIRAAGVLGLAADKREVGEDVTDYLIKKAVSLLQYQKRLAGEPFDRVDTLIELGDQWSDFVHGRNSFAVIPEQAQASPKKFWKLAERKAKHLATLAEAWLAIPPAEDDAERSFWAQKRIHTDLRNRLTHDAVLAELFVRWNLPRYMEYEEMKASLDASDDVQPDTSKAAVLRKRGFQAAGASREQRNKKQKQRERRFSRQNNANEGQ